MSTLPLAGRTILDCSALLPGATVGKLIAAMGARVIKIENPSRPDAMLVLKAVYEDVNGMKERVPLDLTRDADRARLRELIQKADGLIEGFRPAAKKKLGFDEATLLALNPRLCVASLTGYPEGGPLADRPGHDINFQAVAGALSFSNDMPPMPLADLFGAYQAALGLASLLARAATTGQGGRISVSLSGALLGAMSILISQHRATGLSHRPGETLFSGASPCYRIYAAGDGRRVAVGAIEAKFWTAFCVVIGRTDLAGAGYATGAEGDRVVAAVQEALAAKSWPEWEPLFAATPCCVDPVLELAEAAAGH